MNLKIGDVVTNGHTKLRIVALVDPILDSDSFLYAYIGHYLQGQSMKMHRLPCHLRKDIPLFNNQDNRFYYLGANFDKSNEDMGPWRVYSTGKIKIKDFFGEQSG